MGLSAFYPGSLLNKSHISDRSDTGRLSVGPQIVSDPYVGVGGHIV